MNVPIRHYRTTLRSVALVFSLWASLCGTKSLEAQAPTEPPPNAPSDILAAAKNQVLAQNALDEAKLTRLCQAGMGGQEDTPEAISRYRKAAAQGNASAENTLGWIYQCGLGVKKDYAQAIALYEKAAAQDYSPAEANLGWTYQYGVGVRQDYAEAFAWHQKAANHGNVASEDTIGSFYAFGLGVSTDYVEALAWYRKAGLAQPKTIANRSCGSRKQPQGRRTWRGQPWRSLRQWVGRA